MMCKIFILLCVFLVSVSVSAESIFSNSLAVLEDRGFRNCASCQTQISDYNYNKIAEAEEYLFGENYAGEKLITRIERLEDNIFGRRYSNASLEQRVNNITHNYNRTADSYDNYRKPKFRNIIDGFNQTFLGVPTGYTPPVYMNPYYLDNGNRYGSYNDYYGRNRRRRYSSSLGTHSGVHIIE